MTVHINGGTEIVKTQYSDGAYYVAQTIPFHMTRGNNVAIGHESNTQYMSPYNSLYGYSFVEQVYTAAELGTPTGGEISCIRFNMQSNTAQTNHITVYMKNVSRSEFSSTSDYETVTADDIVYEGNYTFANGWNSIPLTTPFHYNGTDNLMIAVHENTSGYDPRYFYYTETANSVLSFHNDNSDPDPYNLASWTNYINLSDKRANIKIDIHLTTTVNNGTNAKNSVPVYGYWADAYLKAEFVMPADSLTDIPNDSKITGMTFYTTGDALYQNVSWGDANFKVFLKEVTDATLSDFTGDADATIVYEGALSVVDGKMTVPFPNAYPYHGGNLLVGVYNMVKGSYQALLWRGVAVPGASVSGYSANSLDEITAAQQDFLPKITFNYTAPSNFIDFETATLSQFPFNNTGTYLWTVVSDGYNSAYCMRSGNTGKASSTSTIEATYTFAGNGSISFDANCMGEGTNTLYDVCQFYIDGAPQFTHGADLEGWSHYTFNVTAGTHTFTWSYIKDNSVNPTGDGFFVDNIEFDPGVPCYAPENLAASNITPNSATITWTGIGNSYTVQYRQGAEYPWQTTTTTTASTQLGGLTPETTYEVQVQSDCGSDGTSNWSESITFTTTAVPVIYSTANWYSYAMYSSDGESWAGNYINFSMLDPSTVAVANSDAAPIIYAAAYADGYMWYISVPDGNLGKAIVDNNNQTISNFETIVSGFEPNFARSMSYNPIDGNMYYISSSSHKLKRFDPTQPNVPIEIGTLSNNLQPFAINNTGEAYGMENPTGNLYLVDLTDASTTLIGSTGVDCPSMQDMAFDLETGELFWAQKGSDNALYWVNPATAETYSLGRIGGGNGGMFTGLFMVGNTTPTCPAPTDLVAGNITKHTAELSWTENGTASEWQIMVNFNEGDIIDVYGNPYILDNLTAETEYTVMVRANCGGMWSDWSNEAHIITLVGCQASNDLSMESVSYNTATLTWTGEGESYNLEYSLLGSGTWETVENILPPYTLTNLIPGSTYEVHVIGNCGADGFSNWSNTVEITTPTCPMPSGLTATNVTKHTADLSWIETGSSTEWEISLASGSDVEIIPVTGVSSYTLTGLAANTEYTVMVQSNCEGTWSGWGETISFITPTGCEASNDLAVTDATYNTATLTWTGEGESYNLQYRTASGTWVMVENVTSPYTLEELTSNTNYEVQVQNNCGTDGLSDWSNLVTFTTAAQIIPTVLEISGDTTVCSGSTTTLTATSDVEVTYAWSTGETTASITVGAGDYSVTVTSATGNELSESVTVTLKANYYVNNYNSVCSSELPFEWLGSSYSEGGSYVKTFTTVDGCDSVVRLYLTVYYPENEVVEISACGSYTWADGNGETYNESGDYTYAHQDANGCTQVDTLRLTILLPTEGSDERTICSSELPYTWNGVTFDAAGEQTATLEGANGCDSVVTMTLHLNDAFEVTEPRTVCASELPIVWNGKTFTEAGTQTAELTASNGCDSIVTMVLTVNTPVNTATTAESCGSYTWTDGDGLTYTESGTHYYEHPDANGCTQVDTLYLTIYTPTNTVITEAVCGSYTWTGGNGVTYTESGTYYYEHQDAHNCTQVDTLYLTIYTPTNTAITEAACGSYTWTEGDGLTYTESGTYYYEHQDAHGCTQVDTLYLTINNPVNTVTTEESCGNYTWAANGLTYYASGEYTYSHQDANGCTQVDTLRLNILQGSSAVVANTICASELPYEWNGVTFTAAGMQTATLTAVNGCDSIVTMVLTVNAPPVNTAITATECVSYTWAANGQTYYESGEYTYAHTDAHGCTQVDTLRLTINNPVNELVETTACGSYTWTANGQTYAVSGEYTYAHTDAHGCTQVDTLRLTILQGSSAVLTSTICASELPYVWNGVTFTEAGMQTTTLTAVNGCDSVVTMLLTVNAPPVNTAITATECGSYTWQGLRINFQRLRLRGALQCVA